MKPHYQDDAVTLYHGDCIEVMRKLPDNSVDAVVTDPPYGLEFMGKDWDAPWKASGDIETAGEGTDTSHPFRDGTQRVRYGMGDMPGFQSWCTEWAAECLRVLKPGGHLLAFGGTRTWHRLACAIEDAGFEVRDSIAWMYGSGFPKSMNVAIAIDKAAGAMGHRGQRFDNSELRRQGIDVPNPTGMEAHQPITDAAREWQGWGTALKPAFEPIVVARKSLIGTVAANVLAHGTGALNIDGARIGTEGGGTNCTNRDSDGNCKGRTGGSAWDTHHGPETSGGRWPANVILDESQAAELDRQAPNAGASSTGISQGTYSDTSDIYGKYGDRQVFGIDQQGGASRFFYTAKADSGERPRVDGIAHPTVKPLDLMRYLVRLVTPPGGTVLEPFAGSGTTLEACIVEGFKCIGIEMTDEYLPLIVWRVTKPIETVMF